MTDLQKKLLTLLDFFHNFCAENDLRYYAMGGTALGAMRHEGFIPWDDDIDVAMPRDDYERLKELVANKDTGIYEFEFPGENRDFVYTYGKMYDTTTTLIENTRYKTKRGIFIDIFPLDGLANREPVAIKRFNFLKRKVNFIMTTTCAWRKGRKLHKNLAIMLMRCIPQFIVNTKKLMLSFHKECQKKSFDEHVYVAPCAAIDYGAQRTVARHEWFGAPKEAKFENQIIFIPDMADEYLTALFGDWRTPPPPENQVTHHEFIMIDLNKSYKDN